MELYNNIIEKNFIEEMKQTIGSIDINMFNSKDAKCLYYIFPFIERIVFEILQFDPDADIEISRQGRYRTLNQVIKEYENSKYFFIDHILIELLEEYYCEDGLRNKLMHYDPKNETIHVDIWDLRKIKGLACTLLKIYNDKLSNYQTSYLLLENIV